MKATNPLYNEIRSQYIKVWQDVKMIDYCMNKIQVAVKLIDGSIIIFNKPNINKEFCFGWNTFGNDYEDAAIASRNMGKSKEYFIYHNLSSINSRVEHIQESDYSLYIHDHYRSDVEIKDYVLLKHIDNLWMYNNPRLSENPDTDRQLILEALQALKVDFQKRLETWWKKYGSDHIVTRTYCLDD